ncbi:MAG: hypothetical protein AB1Z98_17505 [Nannocystaceae bacterium]
MAVSFTEAAKRHSTDASLLDTAKRTANANHLWGFAAECALKAVLRGVDPTLFSATGVPGNAFKVHIDKLWPSAVNFFSGRSEAYLSSALPIAPNPFDQWSVHGRYDSDADTPSATLHAQHQTAAKRCLSLLATARLNGHHE